MNEAIKIVDPVIEVFWIRVIIDVVIVVQPPR